MFKQKLYWHDKKVENNTINKLFNGLTGYFNYYLEVLDDAPFWYIERSQIGNLVQAATTKKLLTVEEYSISLKGLKGKTKTSKNFRPDLWIYDPSVRAQLSILFEAKQIWVTFDMRENHLQKAVNKKIQEAYDQLKQYNKILKKTKYGQEADKVCCIAFLPVYCLFSKWPKRHSEYEEKIVLFLEDFKKNCGQLGREQVSFSYAYFIDSWRKVQKIKANKKYYPGILVAGWLRDWKNAF